MLICTQINDNFIKVKGAWKKSSKIDSDKCYILNLPEELIIKIFSYLDPDTLVIFFFFFFKKRKKFFNRT